jgi:hypothetical protein
MPPLTGAGAGRYAGYMKIPALALLSCLVLIAAAPPSKTAARYHRVIASANATQSYNWSGYNQGYLATGTQYHQISATWVVPKATRHKPGEAEFSSTWVGIGGGCDNSDCSITDATLIQAGTEQDVDAAGKATYFAWWELIPAPSVQITSMSVRPGDTMAVNIAENIIGSEVWTITVQDLRNGEQFSITAPYSSTYATAEWVVETPVVISSSGSITVGPMPKLRTVPFDQGQANSVGANLTASQELQLIDFNGNVLATPSNPDPDADGFNDCTYSTSCSAPGSS